MTRNLRSTAARVFVGVKRSRVHAFRELPDVVDGADNVAQMAL
jgi:hypothetical protein